MVGLAKENVILMAFVVTFMHIRIL